MRHDHSTSSKRRNGVWSPSSTSSSSDSYALASWSSAVAYSARSTDSRASSSRPGCFVRTTSSVHSAGLMRNTSQFGSACSSGVCRNSRVGGSRNRYTTSCAFAASRLPERRAPARLPSATCRRAAAPPRTCRCATSGSTPGLGAVPTRAALRRARPCTGRAPRRVSGSTARTDFKHLDLVVADHLRVPQRGRFHRRERHHLDEVVLDHVAQRADAVVVARTALDAERLRHGDLDLVDVRRPSAPAR